MRKKGQLRQIINRLHMMQLGKTVVRSKQYGKLGYVETECRKLRYKSTDADKGASV